MTKILGIIGLIGSGKTTVAEYISHRFNYKIFSMGTEGVVGDATKKECLELTRQNIQNTSEKYRKRYGMDYFAKIVLKNIIESRCNKALISDIRKPEDIIVPRDYFGDNFLLIFIDTMPEIRFQRLKQRCSGRDPKSFEEFKKYEEREYELYFSKSIGMEDCRLDNNGTIDELRKQIDKLLEENEFD